MDTPIRPIVIKTPRTPVKAAPLQPDRPIGNVRRRLVFDRSTGKGDD